MTLKLFFLATSRCKCKCQKLVRKNTRNHSRRERLPKVLDILRRPPLIAGPVQQSESAATRAMPPKPATPASDKFSVIANEPFFARGGEQYSTMVQTVDKMVYEEQTIDNIFPHDRSDIESSKLRCRWYHFSVHNVRGELPVIYWILVDCNTQDGLDTSTVILIARSYDLLIHSYV